MIEEAVEPGLDSNGELVLRVGRCVCTSRHLYLLSNHGERVPLRNRAVNRCGYCAGQKAWEDLEMLVNDAVEGDAPTVLMVLTTRTATLDMGEFRQARRLMLQAIRRRFPAFRYACEVEYTTGYGSGAAGQRRPHWNWLVKGVPAEHVDELRTIAVREWCRYADAEPVAQYVETLRTPAAALKYVAGHFAKASQRPPAGFEGQRFNCSRDYFAGATVATTRARARERVQHRREIFKARRAGFGAHDAELIAHQALRRRAHTTWVVVGARGSRVSACAARTGARWLERARAGVKKCDARARRGAPAWTAVRRT